MRCSHCGLPLTAPVPHECKRCHAKLCRPELRLCWQEHFDAKHGPRRVKDIQGPGLDRLTPKESEAHAEGQW